ncbi:polysaccharide biosynthesis tyrosine autokinase [Gordonia sp. ABSL11-1]|uniref:polysaccharide biosynthesis tyrosine autokinase n=1 Tax=Gordonia sp. ABSL11-1 TaxID=3053924 RepID=UPI0025729339|nr:polysaccharide biosynthesis tyrosine autokinase [Gordonia sp. ABSL11-1]MDL9948869.1 polysaccharide biosynthesis tyrosine autokinase [Gordonia sp. ABSL11-1]
MDSIVIDKSRSSRTLDQFSIGASVLVQSWWIPAICAIAASVLALGVSLTQTPVYSATASLYVTSGSDPNSQAAYQGSLASQQRVASYALLATSEAVLTDALRRAGSDSSLEDARRAIRADADPETVVLGITVRDKNPSEAARLADSVAESLSRYVTVLEQPTGGGTPLAKATIVSPGTASAAPVSPKPIRNTVLAGLVGAFIGCLLALLWRRLDSKIRDVESVELMTAKPALGVVPDDTLLEGRRTLDFSFGASEASEGYRRLRTNLSFASIDRPAKRILVTSPSQGEGKTTTSLNLAASIAESGKRVVLVDADLRKPTVASALGVNPAIGLTNLLADGGDFHEYVQGTGVTGLDVLASGPLPPNPSELLGSQRASSAFDQLATAYEYVIVDSPPVLPVTDAVVLVQWMDGVILVVRAGSTRRHELSGAVNHLMSSSCTLLGSVVNGVRFRSGSYGYGYGDKSSAEIRSVELASPSDSNVGLSK